MDIRVDTIDARGRVIEADLGTPWVRSALGVALDAEPEAGTVAIHLRPAERSGQIRVSLDVEASAPGECDRCGEPVVRSVGLHTTLLYQPEQPGLPDEEVELGEDDLDVGWYRDGHLALPDILTEAVALELPSRVVCTDTEACDARTEALLAGATAGERGHPAFATLKNLKT